MATDDGGGDGVNPLTFSTSLQLISKMTDAQKMEYVTTMFESIPDKDKRAWSHIAAYWYGEYKIYYLIPLQCMLCQVQIYKSTDVSQCVICYVYNCKDCSLRMIRPLDCGDVKICKNRKCLKKCLKKYDNCKYTTYDTVICTSCISCKCVLRYRYDRMFVEDGGHMCISCMKSKIKNKK